MTTIPAAKHLNDAAFHVRQAQKALAAAQETAINGKHLQRIDQLMGYAGRLRKAISVTERYRGKR